MRKVKQKIAVALGFILVLSTILGQFPANNEVKAEKGYGISNPVIKDGVTTWDCIWFGNYWQSNTTTKEPIKWRVLSVDGDDAFLLADQILDSQPYNLLAKGSITWEACTLRTWLNGSFYQAAFNETEQSAVRTVTVVNKDNPKTGGKGGSSTQDKVYLLSIEEASNVAYGFDSVFDRGSETRCAKTTEYAKKGGVRTESISCIAGNGYWKLRSPGYMEEGYSTDGSSALVSSDGWGMFLGGFIDSSRFGVRPALHINLSSSAWTKAGTISSPGNNMGEDGTARPTASDAAPTSAPAATRIPDVPTMNYGISNPVIKGTSYLNNVTTWDCVWFGNYWQSNTAMKEPVKWRVLSVDGDDAFLMADQNLDCKPYNDTKLKDVTWETCTLRTWLNGSFYQAAFSEAERSAVRTTTVVTDNNSSDGTEGGNSTQDKVYLLSVKEASNVAYGFDDIYRGDCKSRFAKNTEYVKKCGGLTETSGNYAGNGEWWLRSPGSHATYAACVNHEGWGNPGGVFVGYDNYAVRPVLHISLSSSAWRKAGKVDSLGNSTGEDINPPVPSITPTPEATVSPTPDMTQPPQGTETASPTPDMTQPPQGTETASPTPDMTQPPQGTETASPTPDMTQPPQGTEMASPTPDITQPPQGTETASPTPDITQPPQGTETASPIPDMTQPPQNTISPATQSPIPTQLSDTSNVTGMPGQKETGTTLLSIGNRLSSGAGEIYTITKTNLSQKEAAYSAPKDKTVTSVMIPATVKLNGTIYKVTSIQKNAFKKCKKLKRVTIGKNVKKIGSNAFYGCGKLKAITVKTTKLDTKSIGSKAFAKLHKKLKVKVPKRKLSVYKKLFRKKGVAGKKQVIKK